MIRMEAKTPSDGGMALMGVRSDPKQSQGEQKRDGASGMLTVGGCEVNAHGLQQADHHRAG